ncbi:456_t:CDS:2 [Ambispora gerdemannii]|uniref:456_t:CDS:1 n=1 Tax=Ambispora gerdemannii TaxID=144530 RepID=A0A9N8ZNS2_9GLOM|nr:456_t:CDS:2 [Ambispora gerdemannii]
MARINSITNPSDVECTSMRSLRVILDDPQVYYLLGTMEPQNHVTPASFLYLRHTENNTRNAKKERFHLSSATADFDKIIQSIRNIDSKKDVSHRLIHITCNEKYLRTGVTFASKWVADNLLDRFEQLCFEKIKSFLLGSGEQSECSGLREQLFETYAHKVLVGGESGILKMEKSYRSISQRANMFYPYNSRILIELNTKGNTVNQSREHSMPSTLSYRVNLIQSAHFQMIVSSKSTWLEQAVTFTSSTLLFHLRYGMISPNKSTLI